MYNVISENQINITTTISPPTPAVPYHNCNKREGTSFTVLAEKYPNFLEIPNSLKNVLNFISARFPCVTRQYTSVTVNNDEINETITTENYYFQQILNYKVNTDGLSSLFNCNQSLLYGLKRALEISPAESVILVFTFGSMTDYNDAQLLSDVYTLLEEKKSQVYFLLIPGYCTTSDIQKEILNNISSNSFGDFISMGFPYFVRYRYDYQLMRSLEFILSKPLNLSVRILNQKINVIDQYTEVFNVTTSLSYLLIMGDEKFTFNFSDPNENTITFEHNPNIPYNDYNYYDSFFISFHLIKKPAAGSWTLNAQGNGLLTVQILGFTELGVIGNCSDSDCHPNATCGEFGGDQQCTCKEGFAGNGFYCNDIDECQDSFGNNCYPNCVNTIGSYTCNCYPGFQNKDVFGCVDIDECADSSLNNCDPAAICTNNIGSYTCTCSYGYYGDGIHCVVNKCSQDLLCNSTEDCIKSNGSYSCIDPCFNHTILNDTWRSTSNTYDYNGYHCDNGLSGWFRFKGEYDEQIPEHCIPQNSCGTNIPIWMDGSHPAVSDGIVNRTACSNSYAGCCSEPFNISVRMCPKGIYVYKLQSTPNCDYAYCTACEPEKHCTQWMAGAMLRLLQTCPPAPCLYRGTCLFSYENG
ncbi:uncharacterized protein ACMZJ9_009901 [Mantella aurantiaca]